MNRRRALATLTAAAAAVIGARPAAAAARPIVTEWHRLQRRAENLAGFPQVLNGGGTPTPRELATRIDQLAKLLADLTDQLVIEHTDARD